MADNRTLIKDANAAVALLIQYPKTTADQAKKIENYFKDKKVGFREMRSDIASAGKDADACDKQVDAAEKTLNGVLKNPYSGGVFPVMS